MSAIRDLKVIVDKVFDPQLEETSSLYAGPLATRIFKDLLQCQEIGPIVDSILLNSLVKLFHAKTSSLKQSLIIFFLQAFLDEKINTLEFLLYQKMPDNSNALEYFISTWLMSHEDFHGSYQIKISLRCMMLLFRDPNLDQLLVPGDLTVDMAKTRRLTRSQSANVEARDLEPLKIRLLKLLIREHIVDMEDKKPVADEFGSEEDDEDDELALEDVEGSQDIYSTLTDIVDSGEYDRFFDDGYDEEDEDLDPEIVNDPLFHEDIDSMIRSFMSEFKANLGDRVEMFTEHLSPDELKHFNQFS